ncbi:alpha-2-macroglobulin family protein [Aurantibacter sp.]|uniref:alpha-2-macroglobulin family protein n=1 Tax=Aurantibacter sp. TaxID=2807103 RepID=UPI003263A3E7
MKNALLILTIILFSQIVQSQEKGDSYDKLWKEVQNLEKEALTASALKVVTTIATKAKKENNSPQMVKAMLYKSKYALTLKEDAQLAIINDFKSEIGKAEFPTKNILHGYLATMYWQYFQNNRYQFYNRTKTETKVDEIDFRTWDLNTLFHEINIHFEASLTNIKELRLIAIDDFNLLLNQQKDSEKYRPSLFDILAHNALEFYKTSENNINRPADKFEIDNPKILTETDSFVQLNINTADHTSSQAKALNIYQKLLEEHINDSTIDAQVFIDIERLKFIYTNAVFEDKETRYLKVLDNSIERLNNHEYVTLYQYEKARIYQQLGLTFNPKGNNTNRWKLKQAIAICTSAIKNHPNSIGAEKCKVLQSQLLAQTLNIKSEKYIPANKPSRLLVSYKNHNTLHLSARKISTSQIVLLNKIWEQPKKLAFLKKLPITKEWVAKLRNEDDYQIHSTEIIIPDLPNNQYVILAEPSENKHNTFSYSTIQVTDFALVETRTPSAIKFQVINRNNGKPIPGATVKFDYKLNYNGPRKTKTTITDNLGIVTIALTEQNWRDVSILVNHNNKSAYYNDFYINPAFKAEKYNGDNVGFIFTDRSIYRPGQPLFFKGIAINRELGKSSVLENVKVNVVLKDVNNQEVTAQQFVTNGFGSFSGEFIVPSSGLTGSFSIEANSDSPYFEGHTTFSVEEYKRPKFETSFKPVTETYKVNDSIKVTGIATSYAGSNLTNAKVSYRVKRVVYYPRWYYWHQPSFNSSPQEIAHGATSTDATGSYDIVFKALPEKNANAKDLPTFTYKVTADVTDINGETQSTTTTVTVGYHTLTAEISVPELLDKNKTNHNVSIATKNLNGQFVPAKGTLKMYKLIAPSKVLRQRPWKAPDYTGFTEEEFKKMFPHDAYTNEADYTKWQKGKLVWQRNFNTEVSQEIQLNNLKKYTAGKYIIELKTKDKFGQEVKDLVYTSLYSDKDKQLADKELFQLKTNKATYEIGDTVNLILSSAAEDIDVTLYIEKEQQIIDTKIIHLNNNSKSITIPVKQSDLGGFAISYSFSAFNSFQYGNQNINVPYPKKQLEIETLTFRDKLKPGTDETWSFKIEGTKGEKIASELLASMYDASLDAFKNHSWRFNPIYQPTYYSAIYSNAQHSYGQNSFRVFSLSDGIYQYTHQNFDSFNWFGFYFGNQMRIRGLANSIMRKSASPTEPAMMMDAGESLDEVVIVGHGVEKKESKAGVATVASMESLDQEKDESEKTVEVQVRKNLQETAFFFPQLRTDAEGNVSFNFTTPEALTKWYLQLLAHSKDLQSVYSTKQTVTQKELMITPNAPRFLREGDELVISSKIANLSDKNLTGTARLELIDAVTGKIISENLLKASSDNSKGFQVDSLNNTQVSWRLHIPEDIQAVQYKVIAKAGDFSDGEQNLLPVLTNRMLVTETLPMWVRSNQTKTFTLDKLKNTSSTSLKNHKLTLEITSNPAWYAVQALPYLMEYPYDCNEQLFSKYYANTLASHISNSNERIKEVFKQWGSSDALLSNLEKNEELKSLLIQETPWLRDAQSESEQKKRIALLFNLNKLKNEQTITLQKLQHNQQSSGAWSWFKGGNDNRFITQHITTGFGHLKQLQVSAAASNSQDKMIVNAVDYLDIEFVKEYEQMKRYAKNLDKDHLSSTQIHYLYMRSFFKDIPMSDSVAKIANYYLEQASNYWMNRTLYSKAMLALVAHRNDDAKTASKILKSLKENSITSEELGMYWKENTTSWYWHKAPIETQALLIEAFSEIKNDTQTIDNLKVWLLKNKQTNQWSTTKATTEAIYALLLKGSDWLSVTDAVTVSIADKEITPSKLDNVNVEAGTGYYKTSWNGSEINSQMAAVKLDKKGKGIAWGALYWQYFEDLDKITTAKTPLQLKKKLFLKKNTDTGEEISEITNATKLKVGDLVRVRIELRSDRAMEFLHMKDMRAAGFEPTNVISTYKWQDGLGYYESTKDASTNFFFDYLPKGIYIFEYDLRVNNAGEFSNGITTIQSMYAPEFSSHSEASRVKVN